MVGREQEQKTHFFPQCAVLQSVCADDSEKAAARQRRTRRALAGACRRRAKQMEAWLSGRAIGPSRVRGCRWLHAHAAILPLVQLAS